MDVVVLGAAGASDVGETGVGLRMLVPPIERLRLRIWEMPRPEDAGSGIEGGMASAWGASDLLRWLFWDDGTGTGVGGLGTVAGGDGDGDAGVSRPAAAGEGCRG